MEFMINRDLAFVLDPRGAMLLYKIKGSDAFDVFEIGIGHASLRACRNALNNDRVFWQIGDRSLTITGTRDAIELAFVLLGPPWGMRRVRLYGRNLETFRRALEFLGGPS